MKYKFTQLKDLPDSPAGTVIRCRGTRTILNTPCYELIKKDSSGQGCIKDVPIGKTVFDNPEWYRKEIDYDRLIDLKCSECGETRGVVHIKTWYNHDRDSNSFGSNASVVFEYACGHNNKGLY